MTWKIEFERSAAREFRKLAPEAQSRIRRYLTHRVLSQDHPRKLGKPLKGNRSGQHSIRINDQWRICFVWRDGNAFDVEITDFHRG